MNIKNKNHNVKKFLCISFIGNGSNKGAQNKVSLGFTLIEIILVVSLMSVISIAVFKTFSNGMRVWARSQGYVIEEDIAIFMEKIEDDLRNTFNYSLLIFEGKEKSISFPSIVYTPADRRLVGESDEYIRQIGVVKYFFNKEKGDIYRQQANYSQALNDEYGIERLLVSSVKSLDFYYYYKSDDDIEIKRKGMEFIPYAVRIEVTFIEDTGDKDIVSKYVEIPLSM